MLSLARLCVATRSRVLALADSDYFWNPSTVWTRSELSKPRANGSDKRKLHAGRPGKNDTEKTLCKSSEGYKSMTLWIRSASQYGTGIYPQCYSGGIRPRETATCMLLKSAWSLFAPSISQVQNLEMVQISEIADVYGMMRRRYRYTSIRV